MTPKDSPSMPRRVTCFHLDFAAGGTAYQMFRVVECLQGLGYEVEIVTVSGAGPLLSEVPADTRVTILQHSWDSLPLVSGMTGLRLFLSAFQLARHLRRDPADVLLSCASKVNIVAIMTARLLGRPLKLLLTITNPLLRRYPGSSDRWLTPLVARLFYARADKILAVSEGLANEVEDLNAKFVGKTLAVPPPLNLAMIEAAMDVPVDHPWFVAQDIPVVCTVGRVSKQKDFGTLIRAIAVANESRPLRLAIVGPTNGPDRSKLESLARSLGIADKVSFLGLQKNPYKFMRQADCFALTSLWEGFGIVVAEALACGSRIVCTDCRHGPAEILEYGKFGRLAPVGEHVAVAAQILECLAADVDEHAQQQRAKLYAGERIMEYYQEIFPQILAP